MSNPPTGLRGETMISPGGVARLSRGHRLFDSLSSARNLGRSGKETGETQQKLVVFLVSRVVEATM